VSPNTFVLVICIMFTIGCVTALTENFKPKYVTENQRFARFCVLLGLVIWGWLIYF
jgi:hypothetical protein